MVDLRLTNSGGILRQAREEAGLSLRELAERLSWNQGTLSKYENGQTGLSLEILEEIADAIGCSREQLAVRCLRERYASLATSKTEVGKLANSLVQALSKKGGK
jgi:transcriptional regulator with XRE-family HTH domain